MKAYGIPLQTTFNPAAAGTLAVAAGRAVTTTAAVSLNGTTAGQNGTTTTGPANTPTGATTTAFIKTSDLQGATGPTIRVRRDHFYLPLAFKLTWGGRN